MFFCKKRGGSLSEGNVNKLILMKKKEQEEKEK